MAEILPLRAIHYDWERGDSSKRVAPPYDMITPEEQSELYARHPENVVRLILNANPCEGDNNRYQEAARLWKEWRKQGVLQQDEEEALYVYHQSFSIHEPGSTSPRTITRRGFMARVRLQDDDEGAIVPHEHTLTQPLDDRLRLTEALGANLSQVFLLYADPDAHADAALARAVNGHRPRMRITTDDEITHTLWSITDPDIIATVRSVLAGQQLLIADGHHRYETNLALLRRACRNEGELPPEDPRRFVLAYLANSADPGVLILPIHRILHSIEDLSLDDLVDALREHFYITALESTTPQALFTRVNALKTDHVAFGIVERGGRGWLLSRPRKAGAPMPCDAPEPLCELDLTILHELVFAQLLGMSQDDFKRSHHLHFAPNIKAVEEALKRLQTQAAFLVNAAPIQQVRAICDAGAKMPQKSTQFYPKVLSGLLFRQILPCP